MLRPRQSQFVLASGGSMYRPKSTMNVKAQRRSDMNEDDNILQRCKILL